VVNLAGTLKFPCHHIGVSLFLNLESRKKAGVHQQKVAGESVSVIFTYAYYNYIVTIECMTKSMECCEGRCPRGTELIEWPEVKLQNELGEGPCIQRLRFAAWQQAMVFPCSKSGTRLDRALFTMGTA
jgi:hypothetical protein